MKVIFQDANILVVYKEAGIKVYRDAKDEPPSLTDQIQSKVTSGKLVFPVHRLDAPTCGLVVFAKNAKTANLLQKKFLEGQIEKTYAAIVHGEMQSSHGKISRPLKHPKTKELQKAATEYEVLDVVEVAGEKFSLLSVKPLTGRFHQIRKHLDGEGCPIVGDPTYGVPKGKAAKPKSNPFGRMALSAVQIDFVHPVTRKRVQFTEYPGEEFGRWLKRAERKYSVQSHS